MLWKRQKCPLMLVLIFFPFKCILIISLCFFFFFTFGQILNCLSTNMIITKKIIIKIPKCLLMLILIFFFLSMYFDRFTVILRYKKIYLLSVNLVVTNKPYEKTLILLINNFKFFLWEWKNHENIVSVNNIFTQMLQCNF